MADQAPTIEDYYREDRTFAPAPEFVAAANLNDPAIYERAAVDPPVFWAEQARALLDWDTSTGSFSYTVTVQHNSTGQRVRLDPQISNET